MAVRSRLCALYVCVGPRARVCVRSRVFASSLEGGMPPAGNGNVLLPREDERRWRGGGESGCEGVPSVVGPQGGTESGRSAGGSQSADDLSCTSHLNRENPL